MTELVTLMGYHWSPIVEGNIIILSGLRAFPEFSVQPNQIQNVDVFKNCVGSWRLKVYKYALWRKKHPESHRKKTTT